MNAPQTRSMEPRLPGLSLPEMYVTIPPSYQQANAENQMELLTTGNTAKLYCLNWIEDYIRRQSGAVSILDLGCGTAANFVSLLKEYPQTQFVGVEPSQTACLQAERNLQGLNAKIYNGYGYAVHDLVGSEFDIVVSFSVLEHVYRRADYLRSAKACLKSGGYFLINYDAGHFVLGTNRDKVKNIIGPILARFGNERYYQSFVPEQQFQGIVKSLGLKVVEAKVFNTALKGIYKLIPDSERTAYMQKWLEMELWLNALDLPYDDSKAQTFVTRNFILQC
jgi:SAM-dependent methyltransferase